MAYIYKTQIDSINYLIEPRLYTTATLETGTNYYTASIADFELIDGVQISIKIPNDANGTGLKIGSNEVIPIYYNGSNIETGLLQQNRIYSFIYTNNVWNLVGDIDSPRAPMEHTHVLNEITDAIDLKVIEELTGTAGFLKKTGANQWTLDNTNYTTNTGTVTSVQVQASEPLQSSTNSAQNTSLNTTISFKNQTANTVLAGPSSGNAASPSFRALTTADLPVGTGASQVAAGNHTHSYAGSDESGGAANTVKVSILDNFTNKKTHFPWFADTTTGNLTAKAYAGFYLYENVTNNTLTGLDLGIGKSASPYVKGGIIIHNGQGYYGYITPPTLSANANYTLPNQSGTLALKSDIPTNLNQLTNGPGYVTSSGVTSITIKTSSPLSGGSNTATTTTGEYTIGFSNQNKNVVLAGPSSGDTAAAPTFRALVVNDLPTVTVGKGGTEITSYTIGDILYASAKTTLSKLSGNTTKTRKFLRSVATTEGTAVAPAWDTVTKADVGLSDVENTKLSTWTGSSNISTVGTITSGTWQGTAIAAAYIGSHTHSYAGSSSAGGAATSANALNFVHTNELLLGNTNAQKAIHINHRRVSGGATSGNTAITDYYFKNGNAAVTGVTIHAANFNGLAAKATGDADGNAIKTTYAKLASPALTGTPTAPTAANGTSTTQIATTEFVNNTLAYINAMQFKGTIGTGGTVTALPDTHEAGDTYRVKTAGSYPIVDSNGRYCEIGTLIICVADGTTANAADWTAVETNEDGSVISSSTSTTNNTIARWDNTSGRIIQSSNVVVDDTGNISTTLATATSIAYSVTNSKAKIMLYSAASGNHGLHEGSNWIIHQNSTKANTYVFNWKNKGSSTKLIYFTADGEPAEGEYILPVYYSNLDLTATKPAPGAYSLNIESHPVTTKHEYGSAISLPNRSATDNGYAAQLLITSESGETSNVHAYIRRVTSTPIWSDWSTLLDNKNTTAPSSTPTLSWGADSTVFTLNGTEVKIKAMAKPSPADIGAAASSHKHSVADITWAGGKNLATSATANNQEWSIDLTPGDYTGTYWHVWSAKKSASILACWTDDRHITMPGNIASTSTSSGTLQVTGGIGATGQVTALRLAANGSNTSYNLYINGSSYLNGSVISKDYTHYNSNGVADATLVMETRGKKPTATTTDGTTTYSGAVQGTAILTLGNSKKYGDNSSGVDDNAQGIIRLYTSSDGYGQLSGRTVAGRDTIYASTGLSLVENAISILYRANSSYYTYCAYETAGNEALVFGTKNTVTSFIFVNGEDSSNVGSNRWQSLTGASGAGPAPGLQIKKNCVSIGELIANDTDPGYKLKVKGTTCLDGETYIGSQASTHAMPTNGLNIWDTRGADFIPNTISKGINFFFTNTPTPTNTWCSGIYVHGWTNSNYAAWCLVGPANTGDYSTTPLYVRTSKNSSTWGAYRKIYDESNKPTPSEIGALPSTTTYAASSSVGGAATNAVTTENTSNSLYIVGVKDGEENTLLHDSGITIKGNDLNINEGTIYFGKTSTNKAVLAYNANNTKFGIWYSEGNPDVMRFSASGNADSNSTADFAINALGVGILSNRNNRIPHTGNTTGSVGGTTTPVYVDAGEIKACVAYSSASVNYATSAGKATNDADDNDIRTKYVTVYNTKDIGSSSSVTFTNLAAAGNAVGMIYAATDNPEGSAKWVHAISLCWTKGTTSSWISQIALGIASGTGMWYRTTSGNIAGKAWTKILDASNYSSYALPLSGGTMTGNINRFYSAASTEPMITLLSNNQDILLFEVGHGAEAAATTTSNHYRLLYKGTGSTPNNYLQLIAHNGTENTDTIGIQFDENGQTYFRKDLKYIGTKATTSFIQFIDNTSGTDGNGMKIGSGGAVVIGSGESYGAISPAAGTEILYLLSDNQIYLETNAQTAANRVGFYISNSNELIPIKAETATNNFGSIGTSTYKWANVYATTFTGNLTGDVTGNADTATSLTVTSINSETEITDGTKVYIGSGSSWTGSLSGMAYGTLLHIGTDKHRSIEIWGIGKADRTASNSLQWRHKTGDGNSWQNPRTILDNVNTYAAKTDGSVISISRNTETKIATINGVDIKIKIPASDNTNNAVTQTAIDTNGEYSILLKKSANKTDETTGTNYVKTKSVTVNPSTATVSAIQYYATGSTGAGSSTPGFKCTVNANAWSYMALESGTTAWHIAVNNKASDDNTHVGALQFRPNGLNNTGPSIMTTGEINRWVNTTSNVPLIAMRANNKDAVLWEIGHATHPYDAFSNHSYKMIYKGTGDGVNNTLQLVADYTSDTIAMQINLEGRTTFQERIGLHTGTSSVTEKVTLEYNSTDQSLDFIFA